ncbi:hypothetical protein [Desulfonema magnum]|uniref:Uncharacterized protein n=1 Tax=Desulfonema magnum TaxID=45655 RepID=A0A975GSD8_9BACT|nr:hypothetical protein [Desulfonema magnum]QTA90973.1 Uncharacterized protein dnm_070370 [Desulfonema magnum]
MERNGYFSTDHKGVYQSRNNLLKEIPILVLNELSDETHNAFVKCFASRKTSKVSAFKTLERHGISLFGSRFMWFVKGLMQFWLGMEGDDMKEELTPEKVMEIGKMFGKIALSGLSEDEILSVCDREKLVRKLTIEERLAGLKPKERLAGLKPKERLAGLKPKERLAGLKPKERLAGLKPKERLAGLSVKEIEDYLKALKKSDKSDN